MSDEGGSSGAVQNEESSNVDKVAFWSVIDRWISDDPSILRKRFDIIRSAFFVHCEYSAIVIGRIDKRETPKLKFTAFMNLVHKTKFMTVEDRIPPANIFGVLIDLFSTIPENRDDSRELNNLLKFHLSTLLDSGIPWKNMYCDVKLVRGIYWQLLFTLQLLPDRSGNQPTENADRPKLMFGCFILSLLTGFVYLNDYAFVKKFPNFYDAKEAPQFLLMLASSAQFRSLCQFFLVGLWLLIEYKTQGGRVSSVSEGMTPEEIEHEKKAIEIAKANLALEEEIDEHETAEIQREWETFAVSLKNKRALVFPDRFRIVGKGGRKPKMPVRKRKAEDVVSAAVEEEQLEQEQQERQHLLVPQGPRKAQDADEAEEQEEPEEPRGPLAKKVKRYQKKASPKKQVRGRNNVRHPDLMPDDQPSTSRAVPAAFSPQKSAQRVPPTAEQTGLLPPIYVMHAKLLNTFSEECKRRETEGSNPTSDRSRVETTMFGIFDEVYRVNGKMKNAPPRTLTHDQKAVMTQYRKEWRRGDVQEVEAPPVRAAAVEEEEEEEEAQVERVATPRSARGGRKPAKKWKRQY